MLSAASYPPLHKTQERGTHSFAAGKGKSKYERLGHPPPAAATVEGSDFLEESVLEDGLVPRCCFCCC